MKILRLNEFDTKYIYEFYSKNTGLAEKNYVEQEKALEYDAYSYHGAWKYYLNMAGHECEEIVTNNAFMVKSFIKENGMPKNSKPEDVIAFHVKKIKPEILIFNSTNYKMLKAIKYKNTYLKLIIPWCGSAICDIRIFKDADFTLSCAPETVNYFRNLGLKSEHLDHGFDPRINLRLKSEENEGDFLTFIGQIIPKNDFHIQREIFLKKLAENFKLSIYSPKFNVSIFNDIKAVLSANIYLFFALLKKIGINEKWLYKIPILGKFANKNNVIGLIKMNEVLEKIAKPGVFGLEMFQIIKNSKMVLNFHADSSPEYASNMRLFEITGVGSCMISDFKKNLNNLFEIDKEVISYKSFEECVEKIRWLVDNPNKIKEISENGQKRCLKDHGISNRIEVFEKMLKKYLA
ncbi:MAG: glycosyltransferase [Candidatus Wallbacteria bacterium]